MFHPMNSVANPVRWGLLPLFLLAALVSPGTGLFVSQASGQSLIFSDQMNSGAGWQYSHFGGTGLPEPSDISDAAFNFNYSALGIPEAPHSGVGDTSTRGLRLAANTPGGWGGDQIAAVYEDANFAGQYTLQVDIWLNWAASGTTEHAGALAGFRIDDAQSTFAPGQNGGGFLFDSDGDASCNSGICDIMLVKDGAELDLASGQYAENDFGNGNQPGYNHTDSNGNLDLATLFPSFDITTATGGLNRSGTQPAGALGFQWVTATLEVDASAIGSGTNGKAGTVKVTLESAQSGSSFVLGTIDNSVDDNPFDGENTEERAANLEGGIGLMITDLFNSQAANPNHAFALFDNVRVYDGHLPAVASTPSETTVPEPTGALLLLLAGLALGCFYRRQSRAILRGASALLAIGLIFTAWSPALAVLNLTGNFDHGSLQSWSGDTNNIQLTGRDNFYGSNRWRWMYFEASDVQGTQPQFSIDQPFAGGNNSLNNHEMVYSYDNENWTFFDNNQRSGNLYTFSNNSAFTQDEVYVAYAQPYSYGRSASHTAQVIASPWAAPTVSGDAQGVIGHTPLAFDGLGRLVPERDIFAYRVTNPATDSATPKHKVVLTTGMHAGEVLGTHTFEGLINWLISSDPRAARLRDEAEFFAYPTLNAAGRFAGNNRATVENPNQDPNGRWHPTQWVGHEDIQANGEAMIADVVSTPGSVDVFVDFHSTIPSSAGDDFGFIEISEGDANAVFWNELRDLQPNVQQIESTGTSWTSANFADVVLGADVDITFETEFGNNRPLSYYETLGENWGIAFFRDFVDVTPGDFNLDGTVDAADYTVWRDNFGNSESILYTTGDGSGTVDQGDYNLWVANFGTVTPALAVPEPTAGVFLTSGVALLVRRRVRCRVR